MLSIMGKRFIHVIAAIWCAVGVCGAATASAGEDWLGDLSRTMRGRYGVLFTMQAEGMEPAEGYYAVDGEAYYLTLGVSEVYGDGRLRYEINNERKEVTEDRVDTKSFDLLNNPTRAFDFVETEFTSSVEQVADGRAVIELLPKKSGSALSRIRISVRRTGRGVEPERVDYDFDGDRITLLMRSIDFGGHIEVRRWNRQAYRAYEMISFL